MLNRSRPPSLSRFFLGGSGSGMPAALRSSSSFLRASAFASDSIRRFSASASDLVRCISASSLRCCSLALASSLRCCSLASCCCMVFWLFALHRPTTITTTISSTIQPNVCWVCFLPANLLPVRSLALTLQLTARAVRPGYPKVLCAFSPLKEDSYCLFLRGGVDQNHCKERKGASSSEAPFRCPSLTRLADRLRRLAVARAAEPAEELAPYRIVPVAEGVADGAGAGGPGAAAQDFVAGAEEDL